MGRVVFSVLMLVLIAGCATSSRVEVAQVGDNKLSCKELRDEFHRLDKTQKKVDSKKGATGTNVIAAIFWIPGLIYTYYDAEQATKAIKDRRSHLVRIYDKKCG